MRLCLGVNRKSCDDPTVIGAALGTWLLLLSKAFITVSTRASKRFEAWTVCNTRNIIISFGVARRGIALLVV